MHRWFRAARNVAAVVGLASVLAAGSPVSVAASSSQKIHMSFSGPYSCIGPCATATFFSVHGDGHSAALGPMRYIGEGEVLGYNATTNCLKQKEAWALTVQNGDVPRDRLFLTTTSDRFCFTSDPNVSHETGAFTITGGKGMFKGATGSGTFKITVLTNPQEGSGVLNANITS
jgi:hypothetical protein